MNFELKDEQAEFAGSISRLLADLGPRADPGRSGAPEPALWRQLAELGVTTLCVPEAHGGYGGGMAAALPVFQAFGRALLQEPVLTSMVLGPTALVHAAPTELQARLLPNVADGSLRMGWAHDEAMARHLPLWVETQARSQEGGWRLDGIKTLVLHGGTLDRYVVSARIAGQPDDAPGMALFLVDADASGMTAETYLLQDGSPAADLSFAATPATLLARDEAAAVALRAVQAAGIAAVCADMVGAMERAYELAREYIAMRQQFGRPIGQNQALRHRIAEMVVSLEAARSMAIAAALAVDDPDPADVDGARLDIWRAKLVVGRQARALCQLAIQLHGGIGMTEEYAVGHYLRRIVVLDQLFGDVDAQAARLAALI